MDPTSRMILLNVQTTALINHVTTDTRDQTKAPDMFEGTTDCCLLVCHMFECFYCTVYNSSKICTSNCHSEVSHFTVCILAPKMACSCMNQ